MRRVQDDPAWILHLRPYQDASQLLDVLSGGHGRLTLIARGSRAGKSRLKGILRPFLPLRISWAQRTDLGTLTGAEMAGAPIALGGDALLSGYYANELLMQLTHQHDPQPEIFSAYSSTIERLQEPCNVPALLREFEITLFRLLGYGLSLDHDAETGRPLQEELYYEYRVEQGPVGVPEPNGFMVFSGTELIGIRRRNFADPDTLRAAGRLLREVIAVHLGGRTLKSRKVLLDIRKCMDVRSGKSPGAGHAGADEK